MSEADQRRAPRILRAFMVRYRNPKKGGASWLISPLRDLSSGGARFLSESMVEANTDLEIQLVLPGSRDPVSLKTRVAWVKAAPLGMVELGVTFEPDDVAVQQIIDAAVAHFLHKQT